MPTRLMVGVHYLKALYDESDESVVSKWVENPYWQHFCGEQAVFVADQTIGLHLALLPDPVASVDRLVFHCRVPPRIVKDHVACRSEVETATTSLQ